MEKNISRRQALKQMFAASAGIALAETAMAEPNNATLVPNGYREATEGSLVPTPFLPTTKENKMTTRTWKSLDNNKIGLLGLGCMRLPRKGGSQGFRDPIDQERTNIMVDYALAHGLNYFDTASGYPGSEVAMGKALSRHPRSSYFIATKLSNQRSKEKTLEDAKNIFYNSLKDLQTNYIDFYLLHSLGSDKAIKERYIDNGVLDWLIQLKKEGKIKYIGFSFHGNNVDFPSLLDNYYKWDFVQIQLNYLDWAGWMGKTDSTIDAKTLYEEVAKRNIPAIIMEPIRGGALANVNAGIRSRLAERFPELTPAGVALTFASSFPNVMCTLSGMSNMEQLSENIETFTNFQAFNEDDNAFLLETAQLYTKNPHIPCTACRYCMPCPSGVDIPGNFMVYNSVSDDLNMPDPKNKEEKDYKKKRKALLSQYKTLNKGTQASACTQCKVCVSKCPQHINIPMQMKNLANLIDNIK